MATLTFILSETEEIEFGLDESVTTLGRNPDSTIVIDNNYISGCHAEFRHRKEDDTYLVVDLNSYNGVRVNGEKVERRDLSGVLPLTKG